MNNLSEEYLNEQQWFKDNVVQAKSKDIKESELIHCNKPMMQYISKEFVDWTHKCSICHAMYGCA